MAWKNKKEYMKKYMKKYRQTNKKKALEYNRQWAKDNEEHRRKYMKQWRKDHPENKKEHDKKYYLKNKEKIKEYQKQYRIEHPEVNSESIKRYKKNHPERYKEMNKKYRANNLEYYKKYANQYVKNKLRIDIKFNINYKIRIAINQSLKGNKSGRHWEDLVGYTLNDLIERLKKTMPKGYDWNDYLSGKLHLDHRIPISAHNFDNPNQIDFQRCWELKNLQLLPAKENQIKGNKLIRPFQPALKI